MIFDHIEKSKSRLDIYLDSVENALKQSIKSEEFWPLNPIQLTAYFSDTFAVDVYTLVGELIEKNIPPKESSEYFPSPLSIRSFLVNHASTGLKTAHNLGWHKTSFKQREDFFSYLFDVLEEKSGKDIFVESGKQLILTKQDIEKIPIHKFTNIDDSNKKQFIEIKLALFSLVWAIYFDLFASTGYFTHGLYPVEDNKVLMIYEYFNLKPQDIWPRSSINPVCSAKLFAVYSGDVDLKINFFGREDSLTGHNNKLISFSIEIDGKSMRIDDLSSITEEIFEITTNHTKYVNELKPLQVVKKSTMISYFEYKDLFEFLNKDWRPPRAIDDVVDKFKDKLIVEFAKHKHVENIREIFDPRNNII